MTTEQAESASTDEEYVTETWTYAGQRVGSDRKRWGAWVDGEGKVRLYAEARAAHYVVAGRYEVQVRHADGKTWRRPDPQYTGERDDSRAAEHATADHIARIKLAAAKVERSHLKQDALDDALAPLMKLAAAYRNQSDQDALAAYVIRQLHAAWAMGV